MRDRVRDATFDVVDKALTEWSQPKQSASIPHESIILVISVDVGRLEFESEMICAFDRLSSILHMLLDIQLAHKLGQTEEEIALVLAEFIQAFI